MQLSSITKGGIIVIPNKKIEKRIGIVPEDPGLYKCNVGIIGPRPVHVTEDGERIFTVNVTRKI